MQAKINKLDFTGQNIYDGFEVHLKSWKMTITTEKLTHKTFSQDPKPELLYTYLVKNSREAPVIRLTKQVFAASCI